MISKDDVRKVAALSRIHLKESEEESFTKNLEGILGYIEKLNELDVSNVEPTSHVFPLENVHREDIVKPLLTQEEALSIAIEKQDGGFKVPKVLE